MTDRSESIRRLNDKLRVRGIGGRIVLTSGAAALGQEAVQAVIQAISAFDDFNEKNDPYGEHDFGQVHLDGEVIFFKIDYFDRVERMHSPDPADPNVTRRIMTVMLACEY